MPLTIRLLETDADILAAYPLMAALRDRVRQGTFLAEVRRQQRDGYELIGGFDGAELVALAGIRPGHILSRGEVPRVYLDSRETAKDFYAALGFTFLTSTPCWIDCGRLA